MGWPIGADVEVPPPGSPRFQHPHPVPTAYPQMLRTWAWRQDWWKAVVGIPIMLFGTFVVAGFATLPILAVAVGVQTAIEGTDFGTVFSAALSLKKVTPASMLWLNLTLASATLIAWALVRWLHHLAPRWLVERAQQVKQRALSRTARSHHGDHLAAMHIEVNAIQYMNGAAVAADVGLREAPRLDDRHS